METDWSDLLSDDDININTDKFYDVLYNVIDSHVPFQRSSDCKYPAWYDHGLINLIEQKRFFHYKWKTSGFQNYEVEFKRFRAMCIRQSRSRYREYIASIESSLKNNPKKFWRYVNNLNSTGSIPKNMFFNDAHSVSESQTVQLFSDHFSSVFNSNSLPQFDYPSSTNNFSFNLTIELLDTLNQRFGLFIKLWP